MAVSTTLEVLATPTRRHILDALRQGEQPVSDLVRRVAISQPAVSKQLRILRDAGLVTVRPDGRRRLYRVRSEPLEELADWLAPFQEMRRTSRDEPERQLDVARDTTDQQRT